VPLLTASALAVGRDEVVQSDLDLTVLSGRLLALTGPTGVGKSTLALTLAGLLPPLGGELTAAPELAGTAGPHPIRWRSRELLTRIGFVFQNPEHSFLAPTVRAELEVGPRALKHSPHQVAAIVEPVLDRLGLTALARANPFTLSGGEKRRLSVAAALATAPRLLVLDEPTFGQDARTWRELVSLIAELVDAGTGVIAISHDREFTAAIADDERRLTR
jgi:energy-coupling factor transport system ATP-binding protein